MTARVAIVGAGVSGLVCARSLHGHGLAVTVFEKSRGTGGRISTRRADDWQFDHGTQYFTARGPVFQRHVQSWIDRGVAAEWHGRFAVLGQRGPGTREPAPAEKRYVGNGGMNAIARHMARNLEVRCNVGVASASHADGTWVLTGAEGRSLGSFDLLVVATPASQAVPFVTGTSIEKMAAGVHHEPCWAVMAGFEGPLPIDFDGALVHHAGLGWVSRDSSKPGRPARETWVLHATPAWSRAHLEDTPESVGTLLLAELAAVTGHPIPAPAFVAAHRWRYALPAEPLHDRCLFDAATNLVACGDWCGGPRVEGAFLSGMAAADRILGRGMGGHRA